MSANPIFKGSPKIGHVRIAAANTNRDGTGLTASNLVLTAGSLGSRIERINITGTGATTAGMVRLYIYDGTNYRLWKEVPVTAVPTPGATTQAFNTELVTPDTTGLTPLLDLPNGYSLYAAPHNAEQFDIIARGGDF